MAILAVACGSLPERADGEGGGGEPPTQGGGGNGAGANGGGGGGASPSNVCVLDESKLNECTLQ